MKCKVSHFSIEIFYIPELGFRSVTSYRPIYYLNWERKMSCCVSLLYQICKRVKHSIEFLVRCIISSWIFHANNVLTLISTLLWGPKSYEVTLVFHVHLRLQTDWFYFSIQRNFLQNLMEYVEEFIWYFKTKVLIT